MQISEANLPPGSKELDKRQAKTDNWKRKLLPNLSHMIILVIAHDDKFATERVGWCHVITRAILPAKHMQLRPAAAGLPPRAKQQRQAHAGVGGHVSCLLRCAESACDGDIAGFGRYLESKSGALLTIVPMLCTSYAVCKLKYRNVLQAGYWSSWPAEDVRSSSQFKSFLGWADGDLICMVRRVWLHIGCCTGSMSLQSRS